MVSLKNSEVLSSFNALNQLVNEFEVRTSGDNPERVPIKLTYAVSKNLKKIAKEAKELEEFRRDLLKKVAELDESGTIKQEMDEEGNNTGRVVFKSDEDRERFNKDLTELYEEEVQLQLHKVNMDDIDEFGIENYKLIFILDWMFE